MAQGPTSVFQFIDTDDITGNMGVIHGELTVANTAVMLEPIAGSYEAMDALIGPNPGKLRLRIKGTNRYIYVQTLAKADWS